MQLMIKKLLLTVLLVFSLIGNCLASQVLEYSVTSAEGGWAFAGCNTNVLKVATKFSLSNTITCSKIDILMNKAGSPTDNITMRVETDSGGSPSGTLMDANATYTVDGSTLGAYPTWWEVTFANSFILNTTTNYWVVISRVDCDATNRYTWQTKDPPPTNDKYYESGVWNVRDTSATIKVYKFVADAAVTPKIIFIE